MKKQLAILFLLSIGSHLSFSQNGASCDQPLVIFPSTDCENTDGTRLFGKMQCLTGDCASYYMMDGSSLSLNPACTEDDERKESVVWIKVRATADNFTINNGRAYIGSGAAIANTKDYTVFAGTCASLSQIACHTLTTNSSATIGGLTAGKDYMIMASPAMTDTKADAISVCITSTKAYEAPGNSCEEAAELSINNSYTLNNAGANADGPEQSFSTENNTWYKWTATSDWPAGQSAYIRIFEPQCNSMGGLQITLWNTTKNCPAASDLSTVVSQTLGEKPEYYHQWTPRAGRTYYISVDGYAGTACQFNMDFNASPVTPLNLVTLEAKSNGKNILLSWVTSEETDSRNFTLEKSRDGQRFVPLSTVEAAGKSSTVRSYSVSDDYPYTNVNYYRLKLTDEKGNSSYSKNVAVKMKGPGSLMRAENLPGSEKIKIAYFSDHYQNALVRIVDGKGRQMYNMELSMVPGKNDYKINTRLFPKGKYHLKLETATAILTDEILIEEE